MVRSVNPMITYRSDVVPDAESILQLYRAAPLRRPPDFLERLRRMYAGSNVVLTAWDGDRLVGILRGLTDGCYDAYLCDMAIHPDYQRQGIGRGLLDFAVRDHDEVQFVLRSSRLATSFDYYEKLGWKKMENGWFCPRVKE